MNRFSNTFYLLISLGLILILLSCTKNEDDYIFNGENENLEIITQITIVSQDTNNPYRKSFKTFADTITTGDTIYLSGKVLPATSNAKELRWIVNGEVAYNMQYQYKMLCDNSGWFYPTFMVVDFFGDTLTKTLELLINKAPEIDKLILPKNDGILISSLGDTNKIYFKWEAHDFDNDSIYYQLLLFKNDNDSLILDTNINENMLHWQSTLEDLEYYKWQIIANDIYDISDTSDFNYFYSGSATTNKAKIIGKVKRLQNTNLKDVKISLIINDTDTLIKTSNSNGEFSFDLENEAKVKLIINDSLYPDYDEIQDSFYIQANEVKALDDYDLIDKKAPIIKSLFPDTLKQIPTIIEYHIVDYGSGIRNDSLKIFINNSDYSNLATFDNDSTYSLILPAGLPNGQHTVKIIASDKSQNSDTLITPIIVDSYSISTINDTTISIGHLNIPIYSNSQQNTYVKFFWDYNDTTNTWKYYKDNNTLEFSFLNIGEHSILVGAQRPDGKIDTARVIVNVKAYLIEPIQMKPNYRSIVYDDITFTWTSAQTLSSNPVKYKLQYFTHLDSDSLVIINDSISDTTYTINSLSLPIATINWQVEAYDDYGHIVSSDVSGFSYMGVTP